MSDRIFLNQRSHRTYGGIDLSDKDRQENDFDQFDTGECTDPNTGTYLAFDGETVQPCPHCGMHNSAKTERPTNKIPYHCANCGSDFVIQFTLIPVNDEDGSR